jgi:hypothetical protein
VSGAGLHYEIAGQGPWVTLAHAVSCDQLYAIRCPTLVVVGT